MYLILLPSLVDIFGLNTSFWSTQVGQNDYTNAKSFIFPILDPLVVELLNVLFDLAHAVL